jgi:hypothetical protein
MQLFRRSTDAKSCRDRCETMGEGALQDGCFESYRAARKVQERRVVSWIRRLVSCDHQGHGVKIGRDQEAPSRYELRRSP